MSTLLSVRIDDSMNDHLESFANQQHQTRTEVVKAALEMYFKNKQSKLKEQMAILHKIESESDYIGDESW